MKKNRSNLFIVISSLALLLVLIIQVNWIFETAKIKEELFNEKANMVLARTTDALLTDKQTCQNIEAGAGKNEMYKIDSLFNHYMKFYNFHINYSFEVIRPGPLLSKYKVSNSNTLQPANDGQGCYGKSLNEISNNNGFELKLIFPEKKQFIMAEMKTLFITSVILIIIVIVLFWRTILSLKKEKEISEHTTDFLNNMTHEFKTPLTNIALASKMITKDSNINQVDKLKHYSEIILQENEKLRLQVEQVLSLTALEKGEIPIHKTALNFHELINDAIKSINIQIENRQGNLKLNLNSEMFVVMGDKTHLTNVICNLIDNALKYSEGKPDIIIKTFNIEKNLVVMVSDKGIGIEKEHQKKVFDKFYRVPKGNVHDVKGFGLGLAYIKKIVELHNGTIELESEKTKGCIFTITLPYA